MQDTITVALSAHLSRLQHAAIPLLERLEERAAYAPDDEHTQMRELIRALRPFAAISQGTSRRA
jgi:hypothetical protein